MMKKAPLSLLVAVLLVSGPLFAGTLTLKNKGEKARSYRVLSVSLVSQEGKSAVELGLAIRGGDVVRVVLVAKDRAEALALFPTLKSANSVDLENYSIHERTVTHGTRLGYRTPLFGGPEGENMRPLSYKIWSVNLQQPSGSLAIR